MPKTKIAEKVFTGDWLPTSELARRLGVSTDTVRRWSASGRLPKPRKFAAGTVRYSAAEVAEAIRNLPA